MGELLQFPGVKVETASVEPLSSATTTSQLEGLVPVELQEEFGKLLERIALDESPSSHSIFSRRAGRSRFEIRDEIEELWWEGRRMGDPEMQDLAARRLCSLVGDVRAGKILNVLQIRAKLAEKQAEKIRAEMTEFKIVRFRKEE